MEFFDDLQEISHSRFERPTAAEFRAGEGRWSFDQQALPDDLADILGRTSPKHFSAHQAEAFLEYLGHDWDSYKKLVSIRNPWERVASRFAWRMSAKGRKSDLDAITPEEFEADVLSDRKLADLAIDRFVGSGIGNEERYQVLAMENFKSELPKIRAGVGLEERHVGQLNAGSNSARKSLHTKRSVEYVAEIFAADVLIGGYAPPTV